jgi:hypothetical protein
MHSNTRFCRAWCVSQLLVGRRQLAQCLGMMNFPELPSAPSDHPVPFTDQLRPAVAAYLARFKGTSRYHTESDLAATSPGARTAAWTRWPRRPHLKL